MAGNTVKVILEVDSKGAVTGVQNAEGAFFKLDAQVKKSSAGFDGFSTLIKGAFAVATVRKVADITAKVFELGTSLEETRSKFETVFGESAKGLDQFGKEFANMAGLTQREFQELAGVSGGIMQGVGMNAEESAKKTQQIISLAADLASFNNKSIQETFAAVRSGILGETEPLKGLGIVLNQAAVKTQALAMANKTNEKSLTDSEKVTAALAVITQKAGVAVGDLERTQDSAANKHRAATAALRDQQDFFAAKMLPTMAEINGKFGEFVIENQEDISSFIDGVAGAIIGAIDFFGRFYHALRGTFLRVFGVIERLESVWKKAVAAVMTTASPFVGLLEKIGVLQEGTRREIELLALQSRESGKIIGDLADERHVRAQEEFRKAFGRSSAAVEDLGETASQTAAVVGGSTDTKLSGAGKKATGVYAEMAKKVKELTGELDSLNKASFADLVRMASATKSLEKEIDLRQKFIEVAATGGTKLKQRGLEVETPFENTEVPFLDFDKGHKMKVNDVVVDADRVTEAFQRNNQAMLEGHERVRERIDWNRQLAESEKEKHALLIESAMSATAAEGNILKGTISFVRGIVQARMAEAIANSTAKGSILGPLAGLAAGSLMAVIFGKLMAAVGGPATTGGKVSGGGSSASASDAAASIGGVSIRNRGITSGVVAQPVDARDTRQTVDMRLHVTVEDLDFFRLNTRLDQAREARGRVG